MSEGICSECKDWTSVQESCCGAKVWVDGGWEYPDDEIDFPIVNECVEVGGASGREKN
jgi:hypothetical protein